MICQSYFSLLETVARFGGPSIRWPKLGDKFYVTGGKLAPSCEATNCQRDIDQWLGAGPPPLKLEIQIRWVGGSLSGLGFAISPELVQFAAHVGVHAGRIGGEPQGFAGAEGEREAGPH